MKQTLLSRLILAGLAGTALTAAQAGQIQASSVSIAREVITTDTQAVIAPSIAYRFAGDVDARAQVQTFQVQFTLGAGAWGNAPLAGNFSITDGVSGTIVNQEAANGANNPSYSVTAIGKSTDNKTLFATFTVHQNAALGLIKQPLVSVNVGTNTVNGIAAVNVAPTRGLITGLKTVVGDLVTDFTGSGLCSANKTLPVNVKHFVALTDPSGIATTVNATADEHLRGGATNDATLVVFPTNIKVNIASSAANAILTAGGNTTFTNTNATGNSYVNATNVMLGTITLTQNSLGYDSNLSNQYVLAGVAGGANANGLDGVATASGNAGDVEVGSVTVAVTASQGFAVGGTLYASTTTNCGTLVPGSTTAAFTSVVVGDVKTLTIPTAAVSAAFGATGTNPVYICYSAAGGSTIPSSSFSAVGTVVKAAAGAGAGFNEQNNVCNGTFYSLGGGLKIDVRNYASSKETSGYLSVLRFINNSDSAVADVWAQYVHQDGKLGNWAKLADLPVRGVVNMTATQIDAKLAAGSTATAAVGTAAPVAQAATATTSDTAPRLRITSTSGKSLRVQNYLFNSATGQILEGSGQQGVDFEGTATRAPGSEGQYQDQDANSGLNLAQ